MGRELIEFNELIDIDQVIIDRPARQRQNDLDLDWLIDSIRQRGLINPIVVDDRNRLVAGERRLEAFKALGYTEIPFKRSSALSALEHSLLEYEENAKRKDLSWQDNAQAVAKLVELMKADDPDLSVEQLSLRIGLHKGHLARIQRVVRGFDQEKVRGASNILEADNFLARQRQRANVEMLDELINVDKQIVEETRAKETEPKSVEELFGQDQGKEVVPSYEATEKIDIRSAVVLPKAKAERLSKTVVRPAELDLRNEDFLAWLAKRTPSDEKFNLIHCDFPYGKNVSGEDLVEGKSKTYGKMSGVNHSYDDRPEVYFELLSAFTRDFNSFASVSCHVVFWYTKEHEERTVDALRSCGLTLYRFPLVWLKSDNKGVCSDPKRVPRHVYETALFGYRGDRNIVKLVADAYSAPTDRALHPSAKSEPVLRHFFAMLVDQHTTLFDPTCGSGSALRAAESLGAKRVFGLEKNKDFAEGAQRELSRFRTLRALE